MLFMRNLSDICIAQLRDCQTLDVQNSMVLRGSARHRLQIKIDLLFMNDLPQLRLVFTKEFFKPSAPS